MRAMNIGDENTLTADKLMLSTAQYMGMKVVVSPHLVPAPKVQLSPDFKWCSDEFRASENAYLLKMFGTKEVCYMLNKGTIVMSPKHVAALKVAGIAP